MPESCLTVTELYQSQRCSVKELRAHVAWSMSTRLERSQRPPPARALYPETPPGGAAPTHNRYMETIAPPERVRAPVAADPPQRPPSPPLRFQRRSRRTRCLCRSVRARPPGRRQTPRIQPTLDARCSWQAAETSLRNAPSPCSSSSTL